MVGAQAAGLTIQKCTATAGKSDGTDSISLSGACGVSSNDLSSAVAARVRLWSDAEDLLVCEWTFSISPSNITAGKYTSPKSAGPATGPQATLTLDTKAGKFSFAARNVDLAGLCCPIRFEILVGGYVGEGLAGEDIVNGSTKCMPIQFLQGVTDTLVVTKAKVTNGRTASSDSAAISGLFAVADEDALKAALVPGAAVRVSLGSQEWPMPGGLGPAAKFDLAKGTFSVNLKGVSIVGHGRVDFAVDIGGFALLAADAVDLGAGYTFWELSQYDQVGRCWTYDTRLGGRESNTTCVNSDGADRYRIHEDEPGATADFYFHKHSDAADWTGLVIDSDELGGEMSMDFHVGNWPPSLRLGQTHLSDSSATGYIQVGGVRIDIVDGTASLKQSLGSTMARVTVRAGGYETVKFDEVLDFKGTLEYRSETLGTVQIVMTQSNYAVPGYGMVKRTRKLALKMVLYEYGRANETVQDVYQLSHE